MGKTARLLAFVALVSVTAYACQGDNRPPTSPSATPVTGSGYTTAWQCARLASAAPGTWSFPVSPACASGGAAALSTGISQVIFQAPGNLRETVTGSTVRLDWDAVPEAVTSYRVEAGSSPGLANLATLNTANAGTFVIVTGVPNGVYYVRVRGVGSDQIPGPASNEVVVTVGTTGPGPCSGPPGAPSNLTASVAGSTVNLSWAAGAGDAAQSYIVEAGTSSGASNATVFDTGNPGTSLSAVAPNGVFYVRVKGRNACGTSGASNEVVAAVGTTPPNPNPNPPTPGQCAFSLTASTTTFTDAGGTGTVRVNTTAGCVWTLSSNAPWLQVSSTTGSGQTDVGFSVLANTGAGRSGRMTVTGQQGGTASADITQNALTPTYTVNVSGGGNCNVHVTCFECVLTATTNVPSPSSYFWDLGAGATAMTPTGTLVGPDFTGHHLAACQAPAGQIAVSVKVTVTGAGGATATGSGNITVFRT